MGRVCVSVKHNVAVFYLIPHLSGLRSRYPDISLDFRVSHDFADLNRMEADIAVRLNRPSKGNYTMQRAGTARFVAYAQRSFASDGPFASLSGRLADIPEISRNIWIVARQELQTATHIRVVKDWLLACLRAAE